LTRPREADAKTASRIDCFEAGGNALFHAPVPRSTIIFASRFASPGAAFGTLKGADTPD
jgi:hypothetical protein